MELGNSRDLDNHMTHKYPLFPFYNRVCACLFLCIGICRITLKNRAGKVPTLFSSFSFALFQHDKTHETFSLMRASQS